MSESSLSLGYADFQAVTGRYLGYTGTPGNWTADETADVDTIIQSAVRRFYFPPPVDPAGSGHRWSFLFVNTTLALVQDDYDYDAPDNFGGMVAPPTFSNDDTGYYHLLKVSEAEIRRRQQSGGGDQVGPPKIYAIRPKGQAGSAGQRFEFLFWPTPDGSYTLGYSFMVLTSKLTTGAPYPLGGAAFAETIQQGCLAVAEERKEESQGAQAVAYREMLLGSIALDRQLTAPDHFGYSGDDVEPMYPRHYGSTTFTVNGATPS